MRVDDILDCVLKNSLIKLDNNLRENNKKIIFYYEFEILQSISFDIKSYDLNIKYISNIFDEIITNINLKIDDTQLKTIKEYLIAQIRYSFIFPIFLKYNTLTIILSCINILFQQLSINIKIEQIISRINSSEKITLNDIKNCSSLFNLYFFPYKKNNTNNNNENNTNEKINIDIIKKLNFVNSDKINSFSCENINDNISKINK